MIKYIITIQEQVDNIYQPVKEVHCLFNSELSAIDYCLEKYPNCNIVTVKRTVVSEGQDDK